MGLTNLADTCGTDKGSHQGFMELYERYLPDPELPIHLVELGVYEGASLKLWSDIFKHKHTWIRGIDIDLSHCTRSDLPPTVKTYRGDQACSILAEKVANVRKAHIVIDDASHISKKTIASFYTWWPRVRDGGLYVVEDTHCSYDVDYYGHGSASTPEMDTYVDWGTGEPAYTTMGFLKRLADDVNWNYHGYNRFEPLFRDIAFVHFYPGIALIGKK